MPRESDYDNLLQEGQIACVSQHFRKFIKLRLRVTNCEVREVREMRCDKRDIDRFISGWNIEPGDVLKKG